MAPIHSKPAPAETEDGRAGAAPGPPSGIVIENVSPELDCGRYPVKRVLGEALEVTADIHAPGTPVLAAALLWRRQHDPDWREIPMRELPNDAWSAGWTPDGLGRYEYTLLAWRDPFAAWRRDMLKRIEAGQDGELDYREGAGLVREALERAAEPEAGGLRRIIAALEDADAARRAHAVRDPGAALLMAGFADRRRGAAYDKILTLVVDQEKARFSAWYEFFPRSAGKDPRRGATLREAEAVLPDIAAMGFDVVYLAPIHPIGRSFRKGPNNSPTAGPEDPGSPWAIGSEEGGHKAVDPGLGTLGDFDHFHEAARAAGLELALDVAFQCSPDHPYVREHPDWFLRLPDGSIRYAENPPKKYEDIYPLDLECADWRALWTELTEVVLFWARRGVRLFRVDNPHTKPYRFWETLIQTVQTSYPDALFLAEAFTRPKPMRCLAKCGFSQSYTYFTWRNTKQELTEYFEELTGTEVREYLRPNLFVNTPDIFHAYLQQGGRAAHEVRLVLAATLGASYGVYGPPFELCEGAFIPGTEDYRDSEKYQIRVWDRGRPGNIKDLIARVNRIRRENPALRLDRPLRFCAVDNDALIAYAKHTPDRSNVILTIVNLDPRWAQSGWVQVPWREWGLEPDAAHTVLDLLDGARYAWRGTSNYVRLDPAVRPAHILRLAPGG